MKKSILFLVLILGACTDYKTKILNQKIEVEPANTASNKEKSDWVKRNYPLMIYKNILDPAIKYHYRDYPYEKPHTASTLFFSWTYFLQETDASMNKLSKLNWDIILKQKKPYHCYMGLSLNPSLNTFRSGYLHLGDGEYDEYLGRSEYHCEQIINNEKRDFSFVFDSSGTTGDSFYLETKTNAKYKNLKTAYESLKKEMSPTLKKQRKIKMKLPETDPRNYDHWLSFYNTINNSDFTDILESFFYSSKKLKLISHISDKNFLPPKALSFEGVKLKIRDNFCYNFSFNQKKNLQATVWHYAKKNSNKPSKDEDILIHLKLGSCESFITTKNTLDTETLEFSVAKTNDKNFIFISEHQDSSHYF